VPGTQTHLFAGREFLRSNQQVISKENFDYFLMGTIFPDFGYWPGKDKQFSDLSHYVGSSMLPKMMYDNAETEAWKAFALGWLLHVHLDILGHPFVNRLGVTVNGSHKSELTYEEDPALHAKIEFGLDLALLNRFGKLRVENFKLPNLAENPLAIAYKLCYGLELGKDEIQGFNNVPKMVKWFNVAQSFLIGHKGLTAILTNIVARAMPDKIEIVDSILNPIKPSKSTIDDYLNIIDLSISEFVKDENPSWLESNYNLDTGKISQLGDYKLADKMFKIVDKRLNPQNIQNRYPKVAEEILRNWEKIRKVYIGSLG